MNNLENTTFQILEKKNNNFFQFQLDDNVYDTDHTDFNSDFDESELRRELLQDVCNKFKLTQKKKIVKMILDASVILQRWRMLFDKFDPEGFGEIPVDDFLAALKSSELQSQVPFNKIELLYHRAINKKSGVISFQEFVNVVSIISSNMSFLQLDH